MQTAPPNALARGTVLRIQIPQLRARWCVLLTDASKVPAAVARLGVVPLATNAPDDALNPQVQPTAENKLQASTMWRARIEQAFGARPEWVIGAPKGGVSADELTAIDRAMRSLFGL